MYQKSGLPQLLVSIYVSFRILVSEMSHAYVIAPTLGNHRASPHPKVMLISFDGFRHDYLDRPVPKPTLDELANNGAYVPRVKNVFPTKTLPNHVSLVTGLHPGHHGGLSQNIYDRLKKMDVNLFGNEAQEYIADNPGVLPLWTLNEMAGQGRYSGVSMWAGGQLRYGPQKSRPRHFLAFSSKMPWEQRADAALSWFVDESAPANLVVFYLEEPDQSGHDFGPDSPEVDHALKKVDNLVEYIEKGLKKLGLWDEMNLILTSDHGMSPVKGTNILDLSKYVNMSKIALANSSPVLFIYTLEGQKATVKAQLKTASRELNFQLFSPNDWPEEWHLGKSDHLPDYIAMAPVGYAFQEAFWRGSLNKRPHEFLYGYHGFDNNMEAMHGFMIGHGPGFERGVRLEGPPADGSHNGGTDTPMTILDVYPMVSEILGLTPPPSSGSLARVKPILRNRRDGRRAFGSPIRQNIFKAGVPSKIHV